MASSIVEVDPFVDVAEDVDELEYEEEGDEEESESEEGEEEEEDEEEDGDEDYVPPGPVSVQSGAVSANAHSPIVVFGPGHMPTGVVQAGGASQREGREDYVPSGPVSVQSGAVSANAHSPIVVFGPGHMQTGVVQAGGASQREGREALGVAEEPENGQRPAGTGGGGGGEDAGENGLGRSARGDVDTASPNCPICMERWTCQGVHRVCCIPCGHVYGRSCLESWVWRCGSNFAKCPQCKRRFKVKDIINLYAPQITVVNDDLEKEVNLLREKNEILSMERKKLLEEVHKLKKDDMGKEDPTKFKKPYLEQVFPGMTHMRSSNFINDLQIHSGRVFLGPGFASQHSGQGTSFSGAFVLQAELEIDGARALDIDASSQILLVSGKPSGWRGGHVLTKISFLFPHARQDVQLRDDTGTVRDLHFAPANAVLPGRLALLASLGKKLSVFSMETNNAVLKYNLPGPSWSCSWDADAPHHIYAGLQDGTVLMFDVRQTAKPLKSIAGLSRHPVHTIHSLAPNEPYCGRTLLTASSVGLSLWDVGENDSRPVLVPETENQGVCISLACGSPGGDIVASFRPKVETSGDAAGSQPSQSPSVTGPVRLGTHVFLKRVDGNNFQKCDITSGNVSDVRMSRSAIIPVEGSSPLFVYGDDAFHGLCVWDLTSFQVVHRLKPHEQPIFDIKYSNFMGPGLLGCVSENRLQFFHVV